MCVCVCVCVCVGGVPYILCCAFHIAMYSEIVVGTTQSFMIVGIYTLHLFYIHFFQIGSPHDCVSQQSLLGSYIL